MDANRVLISLLHYPVYVVGPEERIGLWTQGCSIKCKGCMSKHTWAFDETTAIDIQDLAKTLKSYSCNRLTISGGEPFDQPQALLKLLKSVRDHFKDILVYSGYRIEYIQENFQEHLKLIDVLIDGEFMEGLESNFIYKGSENQRIFILNENLAETYHQWAEKQKNKTLQILDKGSKIYIIGIPYQTDIRRLWDEI